MVLAFNSEEGVLRAEAGITLGEILPLLLSKGWFLPVTPGTKHVTLGGAVANDVHGKNHHRQGCFGRHVTELKLKRTTGEEVVCGPDNNPEWYSATVGGLGLTGLITEVTLKLKKVQSDRMNVRQTPFGNLDEFFAIDREANASSEYTVAWVDSVSRGSRGIYIRGDHSPGTEGWDDVAPSTRATSANIPLFAPSVLLNRQSIGVFNSLYYMFQKKAPRSTKKLSSFFYPLDAVGGWNKLYGRRGFQQYQCVLPPPASEQATAEILSSIARSGHGGFLSVLKTFGNIPSPGLLSFPKRGITLSVDFANIGDSLEHLFKRLDAIVKSAGGRLYPAKDARMSAEDFRGYYPAWGEVERLRDPGVSSSFWRRVAGG